jgi:uncharacterized protein (TIGR02145 family)
MSQRKTSLEREIDCQVVDDITLTTMIVYIGKNQSICLDTLIIEDINLRIKRENREVVIYGCGDGQRIRWSLLTDTDTLFQNCGANFWWQKGTASYPAIIDSASKRKLIDTLLSFESSSASCMWEYRPSYLRLMPKAVMTPKIDTNATVAADINIPKKTVTVMTNAGPLEAITIGGKTWLKRNLNIVTNASSWCYRNNPDMCAKYGRLYNWFAAMSACNDLGSGWRLPDTTDWNALIEAVGGRGIAGTKLKSKTDWKLDNKNNTPVGTDVFGFSALPGGYRNIYEYEYVGYYGYWWSATDIAAGFGFNAYIRTMGYYGELVGLSNSNKDLGFSVRCIRD